MYSCIRTNVCRRSIVVYGVAMTSERLSIGCSLGYHNFVWSPDLQKAGEKTETTGTFVYITQILIQLGTCAGCGITTKREV